MRGTIYSARPGVSLFSALSSREQFLGAPIFLFDG
jgi:hypothetical protein